MNYDYWYPKMKEKYWQVGQHAPSVTRDIWSRRDRLLKRSGFLPFERVYLCLHSLNHEAPKLMIADRQRLKAQARFANWAYKTFEGAVRLDYFYHGWFFKDGSYSPFGMLDYYKKMGGIEEDYPDKTKRKRRDYRGLKS